MKFLIFTLIALSTLTCSIDYQDAGFDKFNDENEAPLEAVYLAMYEPFRKVDPSEMPLNTFTHFEENQVVQNGPIYKISDVHSVMIKKDDINKDTNTLEFTVIQQTTQTDGTEPVTKELKLVGYLPLSVEQAFVKTLGLHKRVTTLNESTKITFHNLVIEPVEFTMKHTGCETGCSYSGFNVNFDLVAKEIEYVEHHEVNLSAQLPYIDFYDFSESRYFNGLLSHCVKSKVNVEKNNYFVSQCSVLRDFGQTATE